MSNIVVTTAYEMMRNKMNNAKKSTTLLLDFCRNETYLDNLKIILPEEIDLAVDPLQFGNCFERVSSYDRLFKSIRLNKIRKVTCKQ